MSITTSTAPTHPLPGKPLEFGTVATVGNYVHVVLTAAPNASKFAKQLRDQDSGEIQLFEAPAGETRRITFDVPGVYVGTAREFTRGGVDFGGDHQGDPDGYPSESLESSTAWTVSVGQRMTAPLRIGNETGVMSLYVWGTVIRATTVPVHGELTPRLDGDTEKMKTAAESSTVLTALAALNGVVASSAASSLATVADDYIAKWNLHVANGASVHTAADTDNEIDTDYTGATTANALQSTVQHIVMKTMQHFKNDAGTGSGVGSASWHTKADWDNLPMITGVGGDTLSASLALASLWHAYESHRVDVGVHGASDTSHILSALPSLYSVYQKIFAVLQTDSPTAPSTDNAGATVLVHRAGLVKG